MVCVCVCVFATVCKYIACYIYLFICHMTALAMAPAHIVPVHVLSLHVVLLLVELFQLSCQCYVFGK